MTAIPQEFIGSDIVPTRRKDVIVASFKFHENGLEAIGNPTKEDWIECGRYLFKAKESLHFCLGDWLNYGEFRWKDTYRRMVEETGFDYQTLRNDKWVAGQVDLSRRRDNLTFEHHKEIAKLSDDEQSEMLSYADKQGLKVKDFRSFVHKQTMQEDKPHRIQEQEVEVLSPATKMQSESLIISAEALLQELLSFNFESLSPHDRKLITTPLRVLDVEISRILIKYQDDNE